MIGAGLVRNFVGQVNTIKAAVLATLAGNGGAGLVGSADGTTVQARLTYLGQKVAALVGDAGSAAVSFLQAGVGAVVRTVQDKLTDRVSVKDFGAVGDGVADDSAAIQAAIEDRAARGGGVITFPAGTYRCNVVLKSGVLLKSGMGGLFGYLPGATPVSAVTLKQAGAGYVVDTPAVAVTGCGVAGLNFQGLGAGVPGGGVRLQQAGWSSVRGVHCDNFADEGVLVMAGSGACTLEDILTTNCVKNRARAATIGAVDVAGTDHFLSRIEAGISGNAEGTVQSANLYCRGVILRATNCMVSAVMGEYSDVGIEVAGSRNRLVLCRADRNFGHGWLINGGDNQFAACLGIDNSQDTSNAYDNWQAGAGSAHNLFSACSSQVTVAKVPRYGFNDLVSSDTNKNVYSNCAAGGSGTKDFNNVNFAGSVMELARGAFRALAANSATPTVAGYVSWKTANTVATTITDFPNGVSGQEIEIFCTDDNTTIQHNGAGITTATGTDRKLLSGGVYRFVKDNNSWRETSREKPLRTNGAYDPVSIPAGSSASTTLACTGAAVGDMVTVGFTQDLQGMTVTAYVGVANVVTVVFANLTGAAKDLPSGSVRVEVRKW